MAFLFKRQFQSIKNGILPCVKIVFNEFVVSNNNILK